MAHNFITNNARHKTLKGRLNTLLSVSAELKFLVGFFYFSGWREIYENLRKNEALQLKLLIGLQVDHLMGQVVEHGRQEAGLSQDDLFYRFLTSLGVALNNEEMDNEAFYEQVTFFLELLENGRLEIRKTLEPNHAKLYLFKLNEQQAEIQNSPGQFITGSSNLTRAGLSGQDEFNVEITDYGFADAESYFDELWERAVPLTANDSYKGRLVDFIRHKSQAAVVSPFEAYTLILKTYLDLQLQKQLKPEVERLLEERGFIKYSYQLDAVNQALSIIAAYNGVIIADVVGLGKSVIAAMVAKNIGRRGMVICPPALMGDKHAGTGWWGYIQQFRLYDWEVESRGKLETLAATIHDKDIEVVIVDEAHAYRNQDTAAYEALQTICRGRTVILLSATPFNNSPADIFSLLKLFIVPGKSGITLEDDLTNLFRAYNYRFKQLSDISKNHAARDKRKRDKAERTYKLLFDKRPPIDMRLVRNETKRLAGQIKEVIAPVVIRRNRLDLQKDFQYSSEVTNLSQVHDPIELFFYLSPEQSAFYDQIINTYFVEEGQFKGAIYQPFAYEKDIEDEESLDEAGNRTFQQQRNLYDFMRRLLVKRFESSFGAFAASIGRFIKIHELALQFIENSGGRYILDRKVMESIYREDEDRILEVLEKYEQDLLNKKTPWNNKIYEIKTFERAEAFMQDIHNDLALFREIQKNLEKLNIVENDPKREAVFAEINEILVKDPGRKIIVFSEYVDTVKHLSAYLEGKLGNRLLVCEGSIGQKLARELDENFNAQYSGEQKDVYDVLVTSDKLAEGVNLNRAGAIINYDIPWNPTRVIQRVGRINRIGQKVFDELFIYNFFPSVQGADVVKSREIAGQKMFLIHNVLGEDAKIFEPDEEPGPSQLFKRLNTNPEEEGEPTLATEIRNRYHAIATAHPEIIERIKGLPPRVKTAMHGASAQLAVLQKKGLSLFAHLIDNTMTQSFSVHPILFEEMLDYAACNIDTPRLNLSPQFWPAYQAIRAFKPVRKTGRREADLEIRALNNLKIALKLLDPAQEDLFNFIRSLIEDIKKYHTLSLHTLGRLGRKQLKANPGVEERKDIFAEIEWLANRLGYDYLERVIRKTTQQQPEVIIALEKQIH